jgi:hypothetical protein
LKIVLVPYLPLSERLNDVMGLHRKDIIAGEPRPIETF